MGNKNCLESPCVASTLNKTVQMEREVVFSLQEYAEKGWTAMTAEKDDRGAVQRKGTISGTAASQCKSLLRP
ncbi:MAG: hypothetical protein ACLRMZ_00090 [Blautia marasmi]